jgi:hypothetical protein
MFEYALQQTARITSAGRALLAGWPNPINTKNISCSMTISNELKKQDTKITEIMSNIHEQNINISTSTNTIKDSIIITNKKSNEFGIDVNKNEIDLKKVEINSSVDELQQSKKQCKNDQWSQLFREPKKLFLFSKESEITVSFKKSSRVDFNKF